ncbi:MAG: hypothetical protein M3P93_02775 [Actinomycetota bacterium]|nr:hypothetical protein [Actinomycetota bacterium]
MRGAPVELQDDVLDHEVRPGDVPAHVVQVDLHLDAGDPCEDEPHPQPALHRGLAARLEVTGGEARGHHSPQATCAFDGRQHALPRGHATAQDGVADGDRLDERLAAGDVHDSPCRGHDEQPGRLAQLRVGEVGGAPARRDGSPGGAPAAP